MRKYLLNGLWQLKGNGFNCEGNVPGSVLSFLLNNELIDDPFYRENEDKAFAILNNEYDFSREFEVAEIKNETFLCCDGLDTLATIYLNDKLVAKTKFRTNNYFTESNNLTSPKSKDIFVYEYDVFDKNNCISLLKKRYSPLSSTICFPVSREVSWYK